MLFNMKILSLFCCFIGLVKTKSSKNKFSPSTDAEFYYFAYDTNMLDRCLRMKIPDAVFYGSSVLKYHRLDFVTEAPRWNGALATISKDPDFDVWGALWAIKVIHMDALDEHAGVLAGLYHPKEVIVRYEGNQKIKAITYVQNRSPKKLSPLDTLPRDRQPSLTYLKIIILGAIQGGLPEDYVLYLYTIRHNGQVASKELLDMFMHESTKTKH